MLPLLGQAQTTTTWAGNGNRDWSTASNWSNGLPTSAVNAIILAGGKQPIVDALEPPAAAACQDLTISAGAVVTINSRKALTVSGNLANAGKIVIKSDENGTGSIIVALTSTTTGLGLATTERWMEAGKWNCIGNPYTSAIQIGGGTILTNFLSKNASNIDPAYGIYVWDKDDSFNEVQGNYYKAISNVDDYQLQAGQAFFVKMAAPSEVRFTPAMQVHSTELALKSTKGVWPTIKLIASVNDMRSSTIIAFNGSMTKGLDPTYDAGLFTGGADLAVYTRLVEDYGIPFAIQALPDNDYKNMVIPVGIDAKTGGEVIFSTELLNLPSECKVILEDKVTKTFTDLSKDNYKVAVVANSAISDRFQLHTSDLISKLGNETLAGKLNAYAIRNTEIRVVGEVSNNAAAKLYNLQGSVVLIENLKAGNLNVIPTANIKNGIYMLSVEDQGKIQTFKLLIRE